MIQKEQLVPTETCVFDVNNQLSVLFWYLSECILWLVILQFDLSHVALMLNVYNSIYICNIFKFRLAISNCAQAVNLAHMSFRLYLSASLQLSYL